MGPRLLLKRQRASPRGMKVGGPAAAGSLPLTRELTRTRGGGLRGVVWEDPRARPGGHRVNRGPRAVSDQQLRVTRTSPCGPCVCCSGGSPEQRRRRGGVTGRGDCPGVPGVPAARRTGGSLAKPGEASAWRASGTRGLGRSPGGCAQQPRAQVCGGEDTAGQWARRQPGHGRTSLPTGLSTWAEGVGA